MRNGLGTLDDVELVSRYVAAKAKSKAAMSQSAQLSREIAKRLAKRGDGATLRHGKTVIQRLVKVSIDESALTELRPHLDPDVYDNLWMQPALRYDYVESLRAMGGAVADIIDRATEFVFAPYALDVTVENDDHDDADDSETLIHDLAVVTP